MSNLIDEIYRKVFNTRIMRKPKPVVSVDANPKDVDIEVEWLDVKLIVMSESTLREVMKLDLNQHAISWPKDRTEPYRMFGIRIAYDDSLPFGKVLVAGDIA